MLRLASLFAALLALSVTACGDSDDAASPGSGGSGGASGNAGAAGSSGSAGNAGAGGAAGAPWKDVYTTELQLPTASTPPISVDASVKFHKDIAYGTDPETRFDIFLPASATPAPLLIHIHGGGFTGGDKGEYSGDEANINKILDQGVAYASLNYRLLQDVDTVGVIKPMSDSTRALQFIRYHAAEFNIDPTKVVLEGGSAGAGTSLWIAFNDEMADPKGDAVAQQSTRVLGVAANATQSTYDVVKWNTVVFAEYKTDFIALAVKAGLGQRLNSFYGISSIDELESPPIVAYRAKVDMLDLMSADDPPMYVHNELSPALIPLSTDGLFHHAYHARVLTERADAVGLPYIAYIDALSVADPSGKDHWDFALDQLKK
ncbi:MAG: carboxylesterase family protein [Polyangiaceae bacterium]